jgi:uncharacterized protein (DUF58 family)
MIRHGTNRLLIAATLGVIGALVAVLAALPEAALLVAPWVVLLTVGLTSARGSNLRVLIEAGDDRVVVGDDIAVTTTITGAAGIVQTTAMPSAGFWPLHVHHAQRLIRVAELSVGDTATVRSTLPAMVWGAHDVGKMGIEVTEPYGLFRWSGVASNPAAVRVHPTQADLRNLLAPWLVRRLTGAHRSSASGGGAEYADIREFGPGDALRDINWRASARSQELWVSQRHPDRATDVILLLDSFVESGHDVQKVVGLAIEAAVELAESHLSVSDRVGLVDLGGVVSWVAPRTGHIQLQRLTDALLRTSLYSNATDRDLRIIPRRVLPPRSFVIGLSPLLDSRFIDALFLLTAQGHDVAVVECAPDWADEAGSHGKESSLLAMRFWEAERDVTRDRLAEAGVSVAAWSEGEHIDLVLAELTRRRHRAARAVRR